MFYGICLVWYGIENVLNPITKQSKVRSSGGIVSGFCCETFDCFKCCKYIWRSVYKSIYFDLSIWLWNRIILLEWVAVRAQCFSKVSVRKILISVYISGISNKAPFYFNSIFTFVLILLFSYNSYPNRFNCIRMASKHTNKTEIVLFYSRKKLLSKRYIDYASGWIWIYIAGHKCKLSIRCRRKCKWKSVRNPLRKSIKLI